MILETERLLLRPPTETDLEAIFELHSDPRTNRHNPAGPLRRREDAAELLTIWQQAWQEQGYGYWAVFGLDAPETVIGFGGVMNKTIGPGLQGDNLYFRFRPEVWGQGYAGEMVDAALETAFTVWSLERVFGVARETNAASQRALERAGLERIGAIDDVPGAAPSVLYGLERSRFDERRTVTCPNS